MSRTDVKLRAGDCVEGKSEPEIGELSLRMGTAPSEFFEAHLSPLGSCPRSW